MGSARIFAPIVLALGLSTAVCAASDDKTLLADETDARNWPSYGRTYNETHFSPLTQINRDTVGQLRLAWSVSGASAYDDFVDDYSRESDRVRRARMAQAYRDITGGEIERRLAILRD